MRFNLGALATVLERHRSVDAQPEVAVDLSPLLFELRDIKAVLQRHHESRPTVSPS